MLRKESQILFLGKNGGIISGFAINGAYRRLCDEAGIRVITSHGARHTSGSTYALMGAGQQTIAQLLGHRHVGTTERYTHIRVDSTQPLVELSRGTKHPSRGKENH